MKILQIETILYVADQNLSKRFYASLFELVPVTDVPGMTEFALPGTLLGLMPEVSIAKILKDKTPEPQSGSGIPRCELYLKCSDVMLAYEKSLALGARPVSAPESRSWGDIAAYVADPDGHIIAFATKNT